VEEGFTTNPEEVVSRAAEAVADIRRHGDHVCFEYAGVCVAYHSDESTTSDWLTRFFEGYLVPTGAGEGDVDLYSTEDPVLFASLQRWAAQFPAADEDESADVPVTDSVILVRRKVGKSGHEALLLLFTQERRIVLVSSGDLAARREEGMQVLRAVSKWLLLERGWIPMHAACVAKDGRVICVAGPKASGKTSTMLNLLVRNDCDLVAVDKFLIRDDGDRLEVCGVPGKIGIRVGSAIEHPRLLDWLARAEASFFPHISAEDVRHIAATNTPEQLRNRKEKIHLLPAELTALFRRSITPTAPLELILIPAFDLEVEDTRLVRVEPAQALSTLTTSYVGLRSKGEDFLLHFFDLSDALLQERLAALLARHLPEVPAYEVHQNHRTNEQTAKLVEDLLPTVR
jgi:hypothetical protein